jgi:predicted amidohydrolase YtcJ
MLILENARIYTLDPKRPIASALAIQGEQILAAGEADDILSLYGDWKAGPERATRLNLNGKTIIPGLTDAHIHLEYYALGLEKVDCEVSNREECLHRVAERAATTPPGEWILGHGWNQNNWPEGFGSAEDLDQVAPDHPVYLTAKSLHAAWANSAALRLAGINTQTPDPEGARLGRKPDGSPDGILFEGPAMELVEQAIPEPTLEDVTQAIAKAQRNLWKMGLTGAHDFDQSRCFSALQLLRQSGDLKLRVVKSIPVHLLPQAVTLGLRSGFGDDYLRIGSVKAFADGALGPQTAAMFQPYEGSPDNKGILFMDSEELYDQACLASENGLGMAVHAIGDLAVHEVLDAYAHLRQHEQEHGLPHRRHRIEHVQLIHPQDANRLAELDIIASMQPIHAPSDMLMADRYWGKRAALSYALGTQLRAGTHLAFGSDAPVESPNPFWGLHAAVTRRRLDGTPGPDGWYPEQRLSLENALKGFTTGAAYAAGQEGRLGQLKAGALADLLVLDRDLFEIDPNELSGLCPLKTMIGGKWVWEG